MRCFWAVPTNDSYMFLPKYLHSQSLCVCVCVMSIFVCVRVSWASLAPFALVHLFRSSPWSLWIVCLFGAHRRHVFWVLKSQLRRCPPQPMHSEYVKAIMKVNERQPWHTMATIFTIFCLPCIQVSDGGPCQRLVGRKEWHLVTRQARHAFWFLLVPVHVREFLAHVIPCFVAKSSSNNRKDLNRSKAMCSKASRPAKHTAQGLFSLVC